MAQEAPAVQADPIVTTGSGMPVPQRQWALVEEGMVKRVRKVAHFLTNPFTVEEAAKGRVIDTTGVPCEPGFLVDAKGQVTPPEGRTGTIPDGLPAYHGGPVKAVTAGAVFGQEAQELDDKGQPKPLPEPRKLSDEELAAVERTERMRTLGTVIPQNREQAMAPNLAITAAPTDLADPPSSEQTLDGSAAKDEGKGAAPPPPKPDPAAKGK